MADQVLDVDALAQKYGGAAASGAPGGDFAAIAQKYGGAPVAPEPPLTSVSMGADAVPYVRGHFTPEELEAIERSGPAQTLQPPTTTLPKPPAPSTLEPAIPTVTRGRFTGLPGTNPNAQDLTDATTQLARGVTTLGRQIAQPQVLPTEPHVVPPSRPGADAAALNAASDTMEAAMKLGTPLAIIGAIADLPGTLFTLGASYVASEAGGKAAELAGASPELKRFVRNLAGAVTAIGGGRAVLESAQTGTASTARALALAAKLSGQTVGEARPVGAGTVTEATALSGTGRAPGDIPGARGVPFVEPEPVAQTGPSAGELIASGMTPEAAHEQVYGEPARNEVPQPPDATVDAAAAQHGGTPVPEAPTTFVRHGETEDDVKGQEQPSAWKPVPLNAEGRKAVRQTAKELAQQHAEQPFDRIVSSDLPRAKETADILGKKLNVPVYTMGGLRPWNVGDLADLPQKEADPEIARLAANPDEPAPNGESLNSFLDRYTTAVQTLEAQPGRTIEVGHSHNAMVRDVLAKKGTVAPEDLDFTKPAPVEPAEAIDVRERPPDLDALAATHGGVAAAAAVPERQAPKGSQWGSFDLKHRAAFRQALGHVQGGNSRWNELRLRGATDEQILAQASQEFGLGGGSGGPGDLGEEHKGGKKPTLILNPYAENKADRVTLQGPKLAATIREALHIPSPVLTEGGKPLATGPVGNWDLETYPPHVQLMHAVPGASGPSAVSSRADDEQWQRGVIKHWQEAAKRGRAALPQLREDLDVLEHARDTYNPETELFPWDVEPHIELIPALTRIIQRVEGQQQLPGETGATPKDSQAVRRAWSELERPPTVEAALASAVPPGQTPDFYDKVGVHYEILAERAHNRALRSRDNKADAARWTRIADAWQAAANAAKLHLQNATSEAAPPKPHQASVTSGSAPSPEAAKPEVPDVEATAAKHEGEPVEPTDQDLENLHHELVHGAGERPPEAVQHPHSLGVRVFETLTQGEWPKTKNALEFRKVVAERLGIPVQQLVDDIDALNDGAEAALAWHLQPAANVATELHRAQVIEGMMPRAHRSLEKLKLQQFSTPLPIAVLTARAADVQPGDRILEPTAGTGNLLAPLKGRGDISLNAVEVSARRADLLRAQDINVTQSDYLHAKVEPPTVIISNPPWGKYSTGKYGQGVALGFQPGDVAERFVAKMLRDLAPNGRLVAVMPTTMLDTAGRSFRYWLAQKYTVRAIIQSPPGAYDTRATTVDSVILVVDKTAPRETQNARLALPATQTPADWKAYTAAVEGIPAREHHPEARPAARPAEGVAAEGSARPAAQPPPQREPAGVREREGSELAEPGRNAGVPTGRDTGVVAGERGPEAEPGPAGVGPTVVEQPERATLDALHESEGEFAEVVDHARDERRAAAGSRQFAPYVRRTPLKGVGHPKLIVEARQLAGVPYPPLTLTPGKAIKTALREKRVSVEQAEQALAAVEANVVHGHGYLAADNVGVGKSREIALAILELMERAKADGRDLRLVVTTKSTDNVGDLIDNELYYVATGRTKDGRDLLNVDAPKQVPRGLDFEVVKTADWPDAKREGQAYKPMPIHRRAVYVTEFYNIAAFRQGLLDVQPHGVIGDEAHRFKNVEGAAAGGAWQNLHATILRGVKRNEQVFAYFTATPAQSVYDYQYLYGLRLWPVDGFRQWVELVTGHASQEDAAKLAEATEKGAFKLDAATKNTGDVIGGDAEDVQKEDKPSKWGQRSGADVFTSKLTPAEAEQIPREWKLLGRFSARDLWREGQEFRVHEATLTDAHKATYDQFSRLAQAIARAAAQFALLDKSGKSSRFGVTGQLQFAAKRIQMQPALEEAITVAKQYVADGYQVVLSVINVTEMNPEAGNIAAAIEKINARMKDVDPDDPDGGVIDQGEIPEAMIAKAELLEQAKALGTFPDPVEMVTKAFGADKVALITGQSGAQRRLGMKEFQEGTRPVAFLSQAGSTGINLDHRVLTPKGPGRGRRVFLDVQFEWSATEAIQRYGRVGRAASVTQPILMPITFGNASEKKFLATIANRMAALGALSKGGAETTGASGLEEFEIQGPDALEAARRAYRKLSDEDKRLFAVVKTVFRSPNRDNQDMFEPALSAPSTANMKDFQLALLFVPIDTSNAFWRSFVEERELVREQLGHQVSSRTAAFTGEVLRLSDLGTPKEPLTLAEVKNQKGARFGILSGLITPRMPIIREFLSGEDERGIPTFTRRYVTFTAEKATRGIALPEGGVITGLQIPWGRVHALAERFGAELARETLDTPEKVLAALKAGERVPLQQKTETGTPWSLKLRKDEKIAIDGAKMADRTLLLPNGAGYSPVGNFFFTTEAKLATFLERFPVARTAEVKPTPPKASSSGGGTTLQSTIVPGAAEFLEQDVLPGLKSAGDEFVRAAKQLQQTFAPASIGAGTKAAGSLRGGLAAENRDNARLRAAAATFQQAFDRLLKEPKGQDQAIDWWDAVQTGQPTKILPALRPAADFMRRELDREREEIQKFGKLEEFNAFYFPQIWKFPKAEEAWVRRTIAGLLGRRPFEGSKSFLKQRKYPTFREGLEALRPKGVEPISYNPVDHFLVKMAEMRRYRMARERIRDFEAMGIWKPFGGTHGAMPDDWRRIEGPLGTIYGPPVVAVKEGFDPLLFEGLEKFARSIGVTLERKLQIGGRRFGYAVGDRHITTKAAGPEGVLMHEIGHILDERYGLRGMVKDKTFRTELRALADLRYEGTNPDLVRPGFKRYVRKGEEKIANLVHAFLWAPERAKKIAPNAYWALYNLIKKHAELRPLLKLQKTRSLKLGTRTHELQLGGFPEIGFYGMPADAARVFNNYLSRGLAGNSAIYDAYRWLNNTMVSGQLAFSGLFHATFTGLNALYSETSAGMRELAHGLETHDWSMVKSAATRAARIGLTAPVGAAAGYAIGGPVGVLWMTGYPLAAMKFVKGWRAQRAWLANDPAGRFFDNHVRQMIEGGFRPTWDSIYDNGALQNALRALRQGNYPGALARTIPAIVDLVTRPVMSWWVPALKTAAYLDAAAFELQRLREQVTAVDAIEAELRQLPQTPRELDQYGPEVKAHKRMLEALRADNLAIVQAALNDVQASIDNRFGEVVYENWFWQRWLKDLTHVLFRSPGWQFGTYKEVLGAVPSQAGILARRVRGAGGGRGGDGGAGEAPDNNGIVTGSKLPKEGLLSLQMSYVLALVSMTMLIGGLEHYLATGRKPKGRDWTFPEGPDGKRRALPTYLRTIVGAYLHPVRTIAGISAPLNTALWRTLVANETYSGEQIREPGDPFLKQAWDALRMVATEGYQPFVFSNIARGEGTLESAMGVAPAAAELQRSDAENYLHDVQPTFTRTHAEQQHADARRQLRDALASGDTDAVREQIASGELSTRSVQAAKRSIGRDSLERLFNAATLDHAIHAYELATPEERYALKAMLAKKYHALLATAPAAERADLRTRALAALQLPVAKPEAPPAAAGGTR